MFCLIFLVCFFFVFGIEGLVNKFGCGIILYFFLFIGGFILVMVFLNVWYMYIIFFGEGFLLLDIVRYYREWVVKVIEEVVWKVGVRMGDFDCIVFIKGIIIYIYYKYVLMNMK